MRFRILVSAICLSLLVAFQSSEARDNRTIVVLKVAMKSGFLGLGEARFVSVALASVKGDTLLSSEAVNSGPSYFFIVQTAGDWKFDADFLNEEMSKLAIEQDTMRLVGEIENAPTGQDVGPVLFRYPKQLKIHRPFTFSFPLDDTVASATMKVPLEYWPNYPKLEKLVAAADAEISSSRYKSAIGIYEQILSDPTLSIFPQYDESRINRRRAFDKCYQDATSSLASMRVQEGGMLPHAIANATMQLRVFQFIADSLANETLGISPADSVNAELMSRARQKVKLTTSLVDSLQQSLDDFNAKWIIEGGEGGTADFKYKYIIPALAQAYLEVDFSDTTSQELRVVMPGARTALLRKFNLVDPFNTFVRLMNVRRKKGLSLFPPEFLANLKTDSIHFSLPFYSALKAVNDFYLGNHADALHEVQTGMSHSFDEELTVLLDGLRLDLKAKLEKTPGEIVAGMIEAAAAAETGNTAKATELYKTVRQMQENYAPASLRLGELYETAADKQVANSMFQKAIQSDPWYVSAYCALYDNAMATKSYPNIIDALTQARSKGVDVYFLHYYLASAFNKAAEFDDALKAALAALALNNRSPEAFNQAGIAYMGLKRTTKARECYKHATEIDPENALANENLKKINEMVNKAAEPD